MKYLLTALIGLGIVAALTYTASAGGQADNTLVLSDRNTVALNMPIDAGSARDVQLELMAKSASLPKSTPIILVLNSPGGSVDAGRMIFETAKGLPQKVNTVSLFSASMSFILSQNLNDRYVLGSTTMMSHRATAGGLEGQLPGSLLTRTLSVLANITELEQQIADRNGYKLADYQKLIADELWMTGQQAVNLRFADRIVNIRCDKSMDGPGRVEIFDLVMFRAKVTFHKCPLITAPISVEMDSYTMESRDLFLQAVYDRPGFLRDVIKTNRFEQVWR